MKTERRLWLKALAAVPLAAALPATSSSTGAVRIRGPLARIVHTTSPRRQLAR